MPLPRRVGRDANVRDPKTTRQIVGRLSKTANTGKRRTIRDLRSTHPVRDRANAGCPFVYPTDSKTPSPAGLDRTARCAAGALASFRIGHSQLDISNLATFDRSLVCSGEREHRDWPSMISSTPHRQCWLTAADDLTAIAMVSPGRPRSGRRGPTQARSPFRPESPLYPC